MVVIERLPQGPASNILTEKRATSLPIGAGEFRYDQSFRGLGGLRPKDAGGGREATGRAVGDLDLILPRQPERASHQVLHEGVGAVHRAASHRDVAAVPKLVDVVFDAPVNPRLAHQIRPHLGTDDLVGTSRGSVSDDAA